MVRKLLLKILKCRANFQPNLLYVPIELVAFSQRKGAPDGKLILLESFFVY